MLVRHEPNRCKSGVIVKQINGLEQIPDELRGCVLTIGNFDGVHRGHQQILAQAGLFGTRPRCGFEPAPPAHQKVVVLTFNPHPLAIVSPHAKLGRGITVGPFSIIEPEVVLGSGCTLAARVVIKNGTILGDDNTVHEGAVLGGRPQHANMPERLGQVIIGSHNTFRENVTVHRALKEEATTRIGNRNLLMVGAHVAHDCSVGDKVVLANNVLLGGFVNVADLLLLLGAWGPNPGHLADINGDGTVNVTDLLALLAAWGPCP